MNTHPGLALVPLLALAVHSPLDDRSARDLERGARCVVPGTATTVGDVIAALSASIDRPLTLNGRPGRPDEELLAREVELDRRVGTFWKIVGELEAALGLEVQLLFEDRLYLLEPRDSIQWRGEWQNHGAFRVRLHQYQPGGCLDIRLQAEPWLEEVHPDQVVVVARGKKAKPTESGYDGLGSRSSRLNYDLSAGFGTSQVPGRDTVDLELVVTSPLGWTDVDTPTLAELEREPLVHGEGRAKRTVELVEFGRVEKDGEPRLLVKLGLANAPLIGRVEARDAAGNVLPFRYGGTAGGDDFDYVFDASEIEGDFDSVVLTMRLSTKVVDHEIRATFRDIPLSG